MKIRYDLVKFDPTVVPGKIIVRIKATALKDNGQPYTYPHMALGPVPEKKTGGKRVLVKEDRPIEVEAEHCVPYDAKAKMEGQAKSVAASVKHDLELRLGKALQAKGLTERPKAKALEGHIPLDI